MAIDESCTRDWATIWQSELSAIATDREVHEGFARALVDWSSLWGTGDGSSGRAAAAAPARAAAAGDALAGLERRIADLERRLAERT